MIKTPITMQTWGHNDDLQPVRIMQGDAMSRVLKITLASRGAPVDLTNTTVTAHFLRPGGLQSFLPADVTDAGAGLVQVTLTSQIAAVPGRVDLIIRAVKAEPVEVLFSGTARIEVMPNGVDDGAIEADNEFPALTVALAQVQQFEGRITNLETGKLDAAEKGVPGGVGTLDPDGNAVQNPASLGKANGMPKLPSTLPATGSLLQLGAGGTVQAATDASGAVVKTGAVPKVAAGQITVTPDAADTPTRAHVDYPTGFFSAAPMVVVAAGTGVPQNSMVGWSSNSKTGVDIVVYRVGSTQQTTVSWIAIQTA